MFKIKHLWVERTKRNTSSP